MTDTSLFNPESFLDSTTDQASERRAPLPVGDYTAVVGEPTSRTWQGRKDPTQSGIAIDFPLTVEIPAETQASLSLTMSTITLKDSIMLDLNEGGSIDFRPGKNWKLRMYREATGLNTPGAPFSVRMLGGKVVKVKITHELYEGNVQERVGGVAKA